MGKLGAQVTKERHPEQFLAMGKAGGKSGKEKYPNRLREIGLAGGTSLKAKVLKDDRDYYIKISRLGVEAKARIRAEKQKHRAP